MKIKLIFILIVLIMGMIAGGWIVMHFVDDADGSDQPVYDGNILSGRIESILQLSALEYSYTNAESMSEASKTVFNTDINLPFSGKELIICYDGKMIFGPDVSDMKVDVRGDEKIIITIRHSRLLSHEIDEESFDIIHQDSSLFNKVTDEDKKQLRIEAKKHMEEKAVSKGIAEEADEKAVGSIKEFFRQFYPQAEVIVEFYE